jgi:phage-related protein
VELVGDASSLERSLGSAEASTGRFGGSMGKLAGVAKVAGAAVAGGLAFGLFESVKAAMTAQQATARLDQSFKASGLSAAKYGTQIDAAEASSRKLGFAGNEVKQALGSLVTATGSVSESTKQLSIAEDLARFKGVSLELATRALTMAHAGSTRALKQLGLAVPPVTTAVDALKEAHIKTTTEAGRLELAHAKLQDKMATSAAAIDLVKQKVEGQAQAFAGTAAGSVQVFKEELQHLEVTIGTALLPAVTRAIQVVSSFIEKLASSPAVMEAVRVATQVVGDVMHTLVAILKDVVGYFERHRTEAYALAAALAVLGIAFSGPIVWIAALGTALIEAYKHSQTFRDIVNGAFDAVRNKVNEVMPTIRAIITGVITVAEALWHQFGGTIISVTTTALDTVARVFRDVFAVIGGVITLIGDLIHGRWSKIWDDLKTIVSHAFDAVVAIVKGYVTIVFDAAVAIGKALTEGILHGLGDIASSVKNHVVGGVTGAIGGIKGALGIGSPSLVMAQEVGEPLGEGVIMGWLTSTAALPAKMSQALQNAINAGRQVVQAAQSAFTTDFGALTSVLDSAFGAITGAVQTTSEKALAKLQATHDAAQRTAQLTAAQAALDQAKQSGDAAQIQAAQTQLNDALYAIQVAALEKRAAHERLNLDAQVAVRKIHFDAALTALQDHLAKHGATAAEATKAILALMASYGIHFKAVGQDMGLAWIEGLKEAIHKAASGAGQLSGTVEKVASGITIPGRTTALAAGGIVTSPTFALIGEAGPEAVIPLGSGSSVGGTTINVTVNGDVTGQELVEKVRNALVRIGRNNGTALGGFA